MKPDLYGWFPSSSQSILDVLMRVYDVKTVIEVGAFLGKSTVFFAERCEKVTVVDTFKGNDEPYMQLPQVQLRLPTLYEQFLFNMRAMGVADHVHPIRMSSREAIEKHPDLTADLIYIDASHKYEDVKYDIEAWRPRAKKILCGDDYTDGVGRDVKRAVDELTFRVNKGQRLWYSVMGPNA